MKHENPVNNEAAFGCTVAICIFHGVFHCFKIREEHDDGARVRACPDMMKTEKYMRCKYTHNNHLENNHFYVHMCKLLGELL